VRVRDRPAAAEHRAASWLLLGVLLLAPATESALTIALASAMAGSSSAGLLGVAMAVRSAGLLSAMFAGGILADRYDRRALFTVLLIAKAALLLLLPASIGAAPALLLANVALQGVTGGLMLPVLSTARIMSVPAEQRAATLARWHSGSLTVQIAAPAAIGLLLGWWGSTAAIGVLAVACLAAAAAGRAMLPRMNPSQEPRAHLLREAVDGLRILSQTRWASRTALVNALQVLLPVPVWLYLIALRGSHDWFRGSQGYLMAVFAAGGIIAAALAGRRPPSRVLSGSVLAQSVIAIGVLAVGMLGSYWSLLAVAAVIGAGVRLGALWEDIAVATFIPPDHLGRAGALYMTLSSGLMPVGYALAGLLQVLIGTTSTAVTAAAVSIIATAIGLASRDLRRARIEPAVRANGRASRRRPGCGSGGPSAHSGTGRLRRR
jgi:hypothetical protein